MIFPRPNVNIILLNFSWKTDEKSRFAVQDGLLTLRHSDLQLQFSIIRQRCLPGKYILSDGTWFRTKEAQYLNFFIHGANSISCLMDIFISRRPMKLLHFYFSMVYGLAYAIFSIAYWQLGGLGMCVRVDSGSLSSYRPIKMRVFHQIESCLLALPLLHYSSTSQPKLL